MGPLEKIKIHLKSCSYSTNKMPQWLKAYLTNQEEAYVKEDLELELQDEEIRDQQVIQKTQPLALRLYHDAASKTEMMKNGSTNDNL